MGLQDITVITKKITAATTDTQIALAPYRARRRYILRKLIICNENAAQAVVKLFDDDLNDTTTPARGDHTNAPLLEVCVPIQSTTASGTLILDANSCPRIWFQGGVVGYSSVNNVVVTVELQED